MRKSELEEWVLRIVDRARPGQPQEDAAVELKREWIEAEKAARRLAGHANAAHGEPILWLIGVDEKNGVVGASVANLPSWWSQLENWFDERVAPRLIIDLNVPVEGTTIVALLFETDRAPYVVRNPAWGRGSAITWEVPWREGTAVRSATRADLIRLLVPIARLPKLEIRSGQVVVKFERDEGGNPLDPFFSLDITLYVVPNDRNVVPFHRCEAILLIDEGLSISLGNIKLYPPYRLSRGSGTFPFSSVPDTLTVQNTSSEAFIDGPGEIHFTAEGTGAVRMERLNEVEVRAMLKLFVIESESVASLEALMLPDAVDAAGQGRWTWRPQ